MKEDIFWMKSMCHGSWLHRFQIIGEHDLGTLEMCEICKEKVFHPVRHGRIDNFEYIKYHARDVLTPNHSFYFHEYLYGK